MTVTDVLDLSALTEAVYARLGDLPDEPEPDLDGGDWVAPWVDGGPLEPIVRAVLEALPREWWIEGRGSDGTWSRLWDCESEEAARRFIADLRPSPFRSARRVMSRAVGPPIPAEEEPRG